MPSQRCLVLTGALVLGLAGGALRAQTGPELATKGSQLFASQSCRFCHSIGGEGNTKRPLDEVGSKLSSEEIHQWIVDPKAMAAKGQITMTPEMPSFSGRLTKEQIDLLAAYLAMLKKK